MAARLAMTLTLAAALPLGGCTDSSEPPPMNTLGGDGDVNLQALPGCGKGEFDSTGKTLVCPSGNGCISASEVEGYEIISGNLFFIDQTSLEPLRCLEATGELYIDGATGVANLDHLANLTEVYALNLLNLDALSDVSGLAGLQSLDTLNFVKNSFAELKGVPPLEVNLLQVARCPELTSLASFEPLQITEEIIIENNDKLPECEVQRFAARYPGIEVISSGNNGTGACN